MLIDSRDAIFESRKYQCQLSMKLISVHFLVLHISYQYICDCFYRRLGNLVAPQNTRFVFNNDNIAAMARW